MVDGVVDAFPASVECVDIDYRRLHISVSEEFLNRVDILASFQRVRGERVLYRATISRLSQPYFARDLFDSSLLHRFVHWQRAYGHCLPDY